MVVVATSILEVTRALAFILFTAISIARLPDFTFYSNVISFGSFFSTTLSSISTLNPIFMTSSFAFYLIYSSMAFGQVVSALIFVAFRSTLMPLLLSLLRSILISVY